jgi:predicted nucleotidyltransferase
MIEKNIIISDILDNIKKKHSDLYGLYLFGSHARNDNNADSDLDIAVIFNRQIDAGLKKEISDIMALIMTKYDVIIDNPVFSYNDIKYPATPLRENIKNEGVFYAS